VWGLLIYGDWQQTRLEALGHNFLTLTALTAAASLALWSWDSVAEHVRVLALYATAVHGVLFIVMGLWLGFGFYEDAGLANGKRMTRLTWGPRRRGKDWTMDIHEVQICMLMVFLLLLLGAIFGLRLSRAHVADSGHPVSYQTKQDGYCVVHKQADSKEGVPVPPEVVGCS